ncbi:LPXTG-motif cell wall anchor domain-containing protein [Filimonas lacunae]|uniref:LPXTG-motif cell wall anchor domain-containing protein n=2 Tax=Filimonas lacunae TaxID=477680 RepID=A0A1N7QXY8_9BACT|nr:LPXTG-motif cell wall anchor domain-containing protein [Filimonas lacunae]
MCYRCWMIFCLAGAIVWADIAYGQDARTSYHNAAAMIVMRQIGHQLLLASGDDTSRVMPVQQVAENEYRISFESSFIFQPDSLIAIANRYLATSSLPAAYVVNVLECKSLEVVYGFAQGVNNQPPPCTGRNQQKGCYQVQVIFPQTSGSGSPAILLGAGVSLLALSGMFVWQRRRRRPSENATDVVSVTTIETALPVQLGDYTFYPTRQQLIYQQQEVILTLKEAKLLSIFVKHINELISREQLQKEGWEEEGVITGRSLDMFVSKLRKHLQQDASVKLVNVHGRGYKLEIT